MEPQSSIFKSSRKYSALFSTLFFEFHYGALDGNTCPDLQQCLHPKVTQHCPGQGGLQMPPLEWCHHPAQPQLCCCTSRSESLSPPGKTKNEKMLWAKLQLREGGTRTEPAFGQLRNFPLPQWNRDGKKWDFLCSECPIKWQFPSKELKLFKTSLFLTALSVTRRDSALFTALLSVLCNQPLKFPMENISAFIQLQSSVLNECLEQNLGFLK